MTIHTEGKCRNRVSGLLRSTRASPTRALVFQARAMRDRKSTRLNSSHLGTSYAVFCLKKKNTPMELTADRRETFDPVTYLRDDGMRSALGLDFTPPLPSASSPHLLDAINPLAANPAKP